MKVLRRQYKFSELLILKKSIIKILLSPKKIFNIILVRISYLLKIKRCLGLPLNIFIEPTANCNYRCLKCEKYSDIYKDDGFIFHDKAMPIEFYKDIIDDIGDTLLTLRLWHYGEPLLHNNIFDMIGYAKQKNIIVAISSNLSCLSKDSATELVKSGLDYLVVSFDGASKETYNFYHQQDNFENVTASIKQLVQIKKGLKSLTPFIEMQFIVMKKNEKEIDKIIMLAKDLGVNKVTPIKLDITNLNFSDSTEIGCKEELLPLNKNYCLDMEKLNNLTFCYIPWEETAIRYSGLVLPCCQDLGQKHQMGRVFCDNKYVSFRDIWNNSDYQNFRNQIAKRISNVDICSNCAQKNVNTADQISLDEINKNYDVEPNLVN